MTNDWQQPLGELTPYENWEYGNQIKLGFSHEMAVAFVRTATAKLMNLVRGSTPFADAKIRTHRHRTHRHRTNLTAAIRRHYGGDPAEFSEAARRTYDKLRACGMPHGAAMKFTNGDHNE